MDDLEFLYRPGREAADEKSDRLDRRLVVISNRVPSRSLGSTPSAGGLAVALEEALKARGGLWFGWSGEASKGGGEAPQISTEGPITFAVSALSRRDVDEYYHGFANRALWPVCHYRLDLACLSGCHAAAYFRVNEQFARQLSQMLRADDLIWVHDYHLIPLAAFLRELGCKNRIGFFLPMTACCALLGLTMSWASRRTAIQPISKTVSWPPARGGSLGGTGARLRAAESRYGPIRSGSILLRLRRRRAARGALPR